MIFVNASVSIRNPSCPHKRNQVPASADLGMCLNQVLLFFLSETKHQTFDTDYQRAGFNKAQSLFNSMPVAPNIVRVHTL